MLPRSHISPAHSLGHSQVNPLEDSKHVPPCMQGSDKQYPIIEKRWGKSTFMFEKQIC